ncbi:MAG: winged helix-turn-helix transcriptional regulator [Thaumarchaeota archaeon]|nr:winged helix-turn-helix transcriptional regulator [Nitrososphaerota archaeon]
MKIAGTLILLATLFMVSQPQVIQVTLNSNGIAIIDMNLRIEEGLNAIKLPVEPIPESVAVSINNSTLVPIYENGSLYVFSPTSGNAEINYLANISVRDDVFSFEIEANDLVKLTLKPEIVLLAVPDNVVNFTYVDSDLVVEFYGPQKIEYVVKAGGAATTTTAAETTFTTSTFTPSPETEKGLEIQPYLLALSLAIAALVIAFAAFILRRKGGRPTLVEAGLSKIDLEILRLLRESGGSMMQGDLQAVLRLPKTTLWRHVRKLEKLGYIEIIKEGPFNRLTLVRDLE